LLKGHIDRFDEQWIAGWVFDTEDPTDIQEVVVLDAGEEIYACKSGIFREDLEEGFGHGHHAFAIDVSKILDGGSHTVEIIVRGALHWEFENSKNTVVLPGLSESSIRDEEINLISNEYPKFKSVEDIAFSFEEILKIPGWLTIEAAYLTSYIGGLQHSMHSVSGILELGLYRGRYMAFLGRIFDRAAIPFIAIDAFIDSVRNKLDDATRLIVKKEINEWFERFNSSRSHLTIIEAFTGDVTERQLCDINSEKFNFVSIDASHDMEDVLYDLHLADKIVSDFGVVALDDFFAPNLPGVSEAVFHYLDENAGTGLVPFAVAGGKLFLCKDQNHHLYFSYMKWITLKKSTPEFVKKTYIARRENQKLRYSPVLFGHDILVFSWT
jgi:hypothetical protein